MRRNTWCGKSAQRSYQHKGWCRHSPRGRRLPSVSLSPNANENGALLSKRLWGSAQGVRPTKVMLNAVRLKIPDEKCGPETGLFTSCKKDREFVDCCGATSEELAESLPCRQEP